MRTIHTFILLLVCTLLAGCFGTTKEIIVTEVKTVYITVPLELLVPPTPKAPIAKSAYMAFTLPERESYLAGYSVSLLGDLKTCSAQLFRIHKLQESQVESQSPDQAAAR